MFNHLLILKNQNKDTNSYITRSPFYFCAFCAFGTFSDFGAFSDFGTFSDFSGFLPFLEDIFWSFFISCLIILFLCKGGKYLLFLRMKIATAQILCLNLNSKLSDSALFDNHPLLTNCIYTI